MDITKLLENFCTEYRIRISKKSKFKAKIITPFGGLDNDPISFVATIIEKNKILLDDNLYVFRYFDKHFYEPSDNALDISKKILKSYGVLSEDFKLKKIIDLDDKYWKEEFVDYITALIRVSDLTFLKKEIVVSEFIEIVRQFVMSNVDVKYKYFGDGIERYDQSGNYPVDIAISNDNQKFVSINAISSIGKISESTISTMYYRYVEHADVFSISIFDDMNKMINTNKAKRLINISDKTFIDFNQDTEKLLLEEIGRRL